MSDQPTLQAANRLQFSIFKMKLSEQFFIPFQAKISNPHKWNQESEKRHFSPLCFAICS